MSQHSLQPTDPALTAMVLIGWDPGLRTFYARVVPTDDAPDDAPSLWIGTDHDQFHDPNPVIREIAAHALIPDAGELAQLLHLDSHPSSTADPSTAAAMTGKRAEIEHVNRAATFAPQDGLDTLPLVTVAGAQVYVYVDDRPDGTPRLWVAVHTDDAEPLLVDGDRVPICITVNGDVVWEG